MCVCVCIISFVFCSLNYSNLNNFFDIFILNRWIHHKNGDRKKNEG